MEVIPSLALGLGHVGLFVARLLWDPSTVWTASNTADQIVHATTALGDTLTGLATRGRPT